MDAERRSKAIKEFLTGHAVSLVAVGLASVVNPAPAWWIIVLLPLSLSHCALLATWIALGKSEDRIVKSTWLMAAIPLLAGIGFLVAQAMRQPRLSGQDLILVLNTMALGAVVFASVGPMVLLALSLSWKMLRCSGFELVEATAAPQDGGNGLLQFNLRQGFIGTAAVALLLAAGQWTAPRHKISSAEIESHSGVIIAGVFAFGGFVLQQISVMLVAAWTVLSPGDVRRRLPFVIFAAVFSGMLAPYYLHEEVWAYRLCVFTGVVQAVIHSTSLLVFRNCGYRLVRFADRR